MDSAGIYFLEAVALERAGACLNTNYLLAADLELWSRFFRHARLFTINSLIGSFRYHGEQKTTSIMDKYLLEAEEIIIDEIQRFICEENPKFNPPSQPVIRYEWATRKFVMQSNVTPGVDALIKTAQEASKAGQLLESLQIFLQVLPMRSDVPDVYTIVGKLYKAIGRSNAAAIAYQKALDLDPANTAARKGISETGPVKKHCRKILSGPVKITAHKFMSPDNFDHFTFSKKSHIACFRDNEGFGPDTNLKVYQDLFIFNFIYNNVPQAAKLLEIGGGESRVIDALQHKYECWNIDKLEGLGNGPLSIKKQGHKLVKDYMGNFSRELPENYFDLVFSISTLEHVPEDETTFKNVCLDIDRVLRPNGYSLHCFDVIVKKDAVWSNKLLPFIFEYYNTLHKFVPFSELYDDPDLWSMSETAYNLGWKPITKRDYAEHGKPISYNVLWQKQTDNSHLRRPLPASQNYQKADNVRKDGEVLVSAIVSAYKSERYLAECLEDLERQTIADRLEIIVVDSGSPQNEAEIVRRFQKRYSNIRYIRTEQREGVYQAWNRGIKAAKGRYITNANTDDRHCENALGVLAKALDDNPDKAMAYARFVGVREIEGKRVFYYNSPSEPYVVKTVLERGVLVGPQPMWRRSIHETCGYFDEGMISSSDIEFWLRVSQHHNFIFVDKVLGEFLENPDSVCHEGNRGISGFEAMFVQSCYREAVRRGVIIGKEGLTGSTHEFIANWHITRLVKHNFAKKFGLPCAPDVIAVEKYGSHQSIPALSAIVYADGNIDDIKATISAMASCHDDKLEIILVSRHAPAILLPYLKTLRGDVVVVQMAEDMGPAFARNAACQYARAELFAFVDAGLVPDIAWAKNTIAAFGTDTCVAIRGRIKSAQGLQAPAVFDPGDIYISLPCALETPQFCAIRRSTFELAGGFNAFAFADHGIELAFRIYKQLDNIGAVTYRPDVIATAPTAELCKDVTEAVSDEAMKMLAYRFPGFKIYYLAVASLYPWSNDQVEVTAYMAFNASIMLKNSAPFAAMRWARLAVFLNPLAFKACFLLGTLYAEAGKWKESISLLERVLTLSRDALTFFSKDDSQLGRENMAITSACYVNTAALLAQSFFKLKLLGKAKTVYMNLLAYDQLLLSPEQRQSFAGLVDRLQDITPEPVEDGMADVPRDAFEMNFAAAKQAHAESETIPSQGHGGCPLVSAIVSTYNSETFIRGCLEDLENQTIADKLEIIVVNSGSEQNEESIVKEFQEKYGNIVYIKTEREGLYSAWNRAIKAASGQFLTSANTDDRHHRDALEVMANTLLKNTDVALVYGNQIITDTPNPSFKNHHVIEMAKRPEFSRQRLLFGCCVGSQPMWRKSLHSEFGGFDETLVCAADWDFWLKIAQKHSFKHIDEFMGLYYRNENGIEHGRKIHSLYERYAVGKRYGNPYISVIKQYDAPGNPLVSIIITAYNAADYISRAIESILIQNYRNFEIIVVDDGSTDNTADIVRRFKSEPIKYFFKENGGVASARNFGLQKSGGEFIIMLDSDDMMMPDYIASHLQGFEQHPEADMIYCDDLLIDEKDKPIRVINRPEYENPDGIIPDMFRCGFPVVHFKTCIRKSVFDKLGLYDERLIVAEDYDMMRRFVKQQLKMRHLPAALYLRRLRADSLSKGFNAAKAKSHFDVIRRITETFTPEQLFPDVQWDTLPAGQKTMLTKCREALAYLGIGEQYINSKAPDYAEAAFDMACEQLDDCCKIEPANQQVRNLREKCQSIRDKRLSNAGKNIYQQV